VKRDLRETPIFRDTEAFMRRALEPGFGRPTELRELRPRPGGGSIAYTGHRLTELEGLPHGRVGLADVDGGPSSRDVTNGPNDDGDPRWSPDGRTLTFRSDRARRGRFQLYRLDSDGVAEARPLGTVPGTVEYHRWSPDGRRILVGVAGMGAEQADALGSGTLGRDGDDDPSWLPEVRSPDNERDERRALWTIDAESGEVRALSEEASNVWEADWCGPHAVVAIVSPEPDEGAWYYASLVSIDAADGTSRALVESDVQLGWVAGSPDGRTVALIEARCSDRLLLAGTLVLIDPASGEVRRIDTNEADVTWVAWRATGRLLVTGLRRTATVVFDVDVTTGEAREVWSSSEASGDYYPVAEPIGDGDAFVTVLQSLERAPELLRVGSDGGAENRVLVSTANEGTVFIRDCIGGREVVTWSAPDGLDIDGFVTLPVGTPPFPLVVHVHGGPVWAYQDRFPGVLTALPVSRGYAVFEPNPRGSGGRGRAFADMVVGDMGGADAHDILSGVDELARRGLVDPERVALLGGSYGGFMSCWLPAMDPRFKAAVAISPVSDWVSQHFTSSLARWDADFLGGTVDAPDGPYRERSPVLRGAATTTPTLLTAGLRDRATPAGQAVEFHQALRSRGVATDVVVYPEEGHGVSAFPALIDLAARCQEWFERFLPPTSPSDRR
jgi:dipeptidyl aminopeptidase/acylaminoacyl peptidase